jgi:hypothetical protein
MFDVTSGIALAKPQAAITPLAASRMQPSSIFEISVFILHPSSFILRFSSCYRTCYFARKGDAVKRRPLRFILLPGLLQ